MKFWFDTEFIEDGKTIDLMAIGIVSEDGRKYYAENTHCNLSKASPWVKENVIPHLERSSRVEKTRGAIAKDVKEFVGENPEIWAYYADYDWVVMCQLFGTMTELPRSWPMYCRDVKQLCDELGNPRLPKQSAKAHNDALWTLEAWKFLQHFKL